MTLIKVCGVTSISDATLLAEAGVDWIGLNFWRESPRYVDRLRARAIVVETRRINPDIKIVGLFVNHSAREIESATQAAKTDYIQLHGDESPVFAKRFDGVCIKAVGMEYEMDIERFAEFECTWMLIDSHSASRGGSGQAANWQLAARAAARHPRTWLAGGLTPENVAEAIKEVKPFGVDVASGVESSPGVKDPEKVKAFIEAVRGCA